MSLHFICGKPGGGKSLFAMRLITDELRRGQRTIVTNVAVKLGELNAYCPGSDVVRRVRVLDMEETRRFWLYRQIGWTVRSCTEEQEHRGKLLDFSQCDDFSIEGAPAKSAFDLGGVLYVIDEAHLFFAARDWAKTGRHAAWYLTQHRKLGDDVVCVTQAIEQVEVAFRRLAEDYTYVANLSKRQLFGFQLPARFVTGTYLKPFTGGVNDRAMAKTVFSLDASGLAACYDTAAGFGVVGRAADIGSRRRGWPWQVGVGAILFAGFMIWWGASAGARWLGGAGARMLSGGAAPNPPPSASVVSVPSMPAAFTVSVRPPEPPPKPVPLGPPMVGFIGGAGGVPVSVALADGSVYREGDIELDFACRKFCVVSGRTSYWQRASGPALGHSR